MGLGAFLRLFQVRFLELGECDLAHITRGNVQKNAKDVGGDGGKRHGVTPLFGNFIQSRKRITIRNGRSGPLLRHTMPHLCAATQPFGYPTGKTAESWALRNRPWPRSAHGAAKANAGPCVWPWERRGEISRVRMRGILSVGGVRRAGNAQGFTQSSSGRGARSAISFSRRWMASGWPPEAARLSHRRAPPPPTSPSSRGPSRMRSAKR